MSVDDPYYILLSHSLLTLAVMHTIPAATGYLAETPEEYATTLYQILTSPDSHSNMRVRARESATRYSDEIFSEKFVKELNSVVA